MEVLVLIVTLLIVLDLAAMRWGVDSRDGFREPSPHRTGRARHALASVLRTVAQRLDSSVALSSPSPSRARANSTH